MFVLNPAGILPGMLFEQILYMLAPHECMACAAEGNLLCVACRNDLIPIESSCYSCHCATSSFAVCSVCRRASSLESVRVLGWYQGLLKDLIKRVKFERAQAGADVLADLLLKSFSGETHNFQIVPIPTTPRRQRQRGYDQAKLIAKRYAKKAQLPYRDILQRSGTRRQLGASRQERLRQLQGVFSVRGRKNDLMTPVLLVDDVVTTGATIEEAAHTLRARGFHRVSALLVAQTKPLDFLQ
ncbi:ComF family protein [Patescibacteria group bacterium]|nr:MAG: ComF family protein [Patescibacteria group bacterium]